VEKASLAWRVCFSRTVRRSRDWGRGRDDIEGSSESRRTVKSWSGLESLPSDIVEVEDDVQGDRRR
jgi:hypothetical protein